MITRILYTTLTGVPAGNIGGGNRIIHDLINNIDTARFSRAFLSYTLHKDYGTAVSPAGSATEIPLKKSVGRWLAEAFPAYRAVVTGARYQKYYRKKIDTLFSVALRSVQCDIIHAHHPIALSYFGASGGKKILTVHTKGGYSTELRNSGTSVNVADEELKSIERREQKALSIADIVTFPSIAAKELFFRNNAVRIPEEKMRIVYNGVDTERIRRYQPSSHILRQYGIRQNAGMYLLNVAEHTKQKNIPSLLKAVRLLVQTHGKDAMVINVGRGPETAHLRDAANEFGIADHVAFLGHIPNDDILSLMKTCDAFVLTSHHVVFDLVVLEALACGMPVFVSDDGGNREIIRNGQNGYLIRQENDVAIAEALGTYDRQRIASQAVSSVSTFSIHHMVSAYERLYHETLCR